MRNIEARVVGSRVDEARGTHASIVHGRGLAILALTLLASGGFAQGKGEPQEKEPKAEEPKPEAKAKEVEGAFLAPRGIKLTPEKRREVVERVLANPELEAKGPKVKAIRVTLGEAPAASGGKQTVTTVVLFDHATGTARRVTMDLDSGKLLQDVELPGRPQSSREEFDEAAMIVQKNKALALLLKNGGVLDGGFIVDDPTGKRRRLIQLKLLSSDRRRLLKGLTVDLTGGVITADPKPRDPQPDPKEPKPKEPDPKEPDPKEPDPKGDPKADPKEPEPTVPDGKGGL